VIGARSAVFSPLKNLGLIIIDEEQESSFKQEAPAPRYHARDVALVRGRLEKATVVLASATPSLESYYNHISGKLEYLHLSKRFGGAKYPQTHIVDMIQDQEESGKYGLIISGLLQDKIEDRLSKGEQIILLQNRRGYSPVMRCGDCGEVVSCNHCNVSLTFHKKNKKLICHYCGFTPKRISDSCKACQSPNMKFFGTGTQRVEDILADTFPKAKIERLDLDTTKSGTKITKILQSFDKGEIDILLGTQMIAKGLDFGNATLVGIINSDLGLHLPDFRAGERIFQLIYQASGRAGRGEKLGEVVIQTYNSENPVIKKAAQLDLKSYYNIILSERKELNYPPFSWIAKIVFTGPEYKTVEKISFRIVQNLKGKFKGLEVLGPAPCYFEKLRGNYRSQIVFKISKTLDANGGKLHTFLEKNFFETQHKIGNIKMNINVNPVSLL
jgi:primosomal protein N' (replication factor Y)